MPNDRKYRPTSGTWAKFSAAPTVPSPGPMELSALTAAVVVIGIALVYAVFGQDNTTGFNAVADQISTEATGLDTTIENANVQSRAPSLLTGGAGGGGGS